MELRIRPSDPGFQDVEFIADWIAKLTPALPLDSASGTLRSGGRCQYARENAHLFHDLKDMPEVERLVHLKDLEELFEQLMH
jgi:hypothetical protein